MLPSTRRFLAPSLALSFSLAALALPGLAQADVAESDPEVTITSPQDGAMIDGAFDVTLTVLEGDVGVDRVELRVDGEMIATLSEAPWTFTAVTLDEGMHSLVAVAITPGDSEFPSTAVNVAVLAGATDDSAKGCTVTPAGGLGGFALASLVLFGLVGMRRRA